MMSASLAVETTHNSAIWSRSKSSGIPICLDNQSRPTVIRRRGALDPFDTHHRLILPVVLRTTFDADDTNPLSLYLTAKLRPHRIGIRQPQQ
jgi:hypothetical protein